MQGVATGGLSGDYAGEIVDEVRADRAAELHVVTWTEFDHAYQWFEAWSLCLFC